MTDLDITQSEADILIGMEKHRIDDQLHGFPSFGQSLVLSLQSPDKRELFFLDISQGNIDLSRVKYQTRARHAVVLVRLDLAGAPHRNPDGVEIPCPHLHVYREGYGDRWAMRPPTEHFGRAADVWDMLQEFMRFCNITRPPHIERGLFT